MDITSARAYGRPVASSAANGQVRDPFDLGIDSKLRACDLVKLRVLDICHGDHVAPRTIVMQ